LAALTPEQRAFGYFWTKEVENERVAQLGRLLGTNFTAGEIRSWAASKNKSGEFENHSDILIPLSFSFRPEFRDNLIKMVGADGLLMPSDYKTRKGEVVVDLSKVSPREFLDFFGKKQLPTPRTRPQAPQDEG
jgi:hypothetical protein